MSFFNDNEGCPLAPMAQLTGTERGSRDFYSGQPSGRAIMADENKQRPIVAGRAPDGVDGGSRAAYEAGMRDRAKIMDLEVDPKRRAATGASEGNGGGGNVEELPAGMRRSALDKRGP